MVAAKKKSEEHVISIPDINIKHVSVRLAGKTDLIVKAWSAQEKAKLRGIHTGAARMKKEPKDPASLFEQSKYMVNGQDCLPGGAFMKAIISATRYVDGLNMTYLRGAFSIPVEFIPLKFSKCIMREDMVRNSGFTRAPDIRYRASYRDWKVELPIDYNANAITAEQLYNLIQLAGFAIGVGEWRPEKSGTFGRFDLERRES